VQENRNILDKAQRKLRWIGHVLRRDSLLPDTMEGWMLGKTTRDESKAYTNMLSDATTKDCMAFKRGTADRKLETAHR